MTERPIYASAELLAPGLVDFSVEAGFARLNQGTESFDYDESPVASGSFGVDTETNAALVTFRLADGSFVPAGTGVKVEGAAEDSAELVVGYDGQVYFDALEPQNTVVLEMETGVCTATFASSPSPDIQQTIEAVCQ